MVYFKILLVFVLVDVSIAEDANQKSLSATFTGDALMAIRGAYHVISAPYNWNSADWMFLGTVTGASLVSYVFDENIRKFFKRNQGAFADNLGRFGELYGEPITVIALSGGIYAYGLFLDNIQARETAILMTAALVPGGAVQTIAKITAGRARPLISDSNDIFKPFSRTENYYSFVSGHTLVAMSISLVLADQFKTIPVKIALYSCGVIGSLSRGYNDDHWFSDILLGGALSWACVRSARNWLNQENMGVKKKNLSFLFNVTSNRISVSLLW